MLAFIAGALGDLAAQVDTVVLVPRMAGAEAVIWGGVGGVMGVLSDLFAWQKVPEAERPWWFKSWVFWFTNLLLLPVSGGVLAFAWSRSGVELTAMVAINLGVSAPLVISRLSLAAPIPSPGKVEE